MFMFLPQLLSKIGISEQLICAELFLPRKHHSVYLELISSLVCAAHG